MPVSNEKIAVIGGGAVGTYVAWSLLRAGRDVIVCTRRAVASLSVRSGDGAADSVPLRSVTEPSALPPLDWVLVATKAQDTGSVGPWLEAGAGPGTVIVLLQNGIDHAGRLGALAAGRIVLPALVHINLQPLRPGQVWHRTGHEISVPAGPEGERMAELFAGSAIAIRPETDFAAAAWRKLLHNSAHNPILTLTGRRADVFAEPDVRELARRLILEAAAVAAARGVMLTGQDTEKIVAALGDLPPDAGNSMLFDRLRGRALEREFITGAIVRAGREAGVPTPLHDAVLALLRAISNAPPGPLPDPGLPDSAVPEPGAGSPSQAGTSRVAAGPA
ncbi:MAG TPA: 2-dehydropantoate 2-reductase [Streptosporangiaceae bacterium]|nr:2-dehydropantoate 2-reductase [Streptosporangiaceae bacterium]